MGKVVGVVLVDEAVELEVELDEAVMVVLPDTETEPLADAVLEPDTVGADVAAEGRINEGQVSMRYSPLCWTLDPVELTTSARCRCAAAAAGCLRRRSAVLCRNKRAKSDQH